MGRKKNIPIERSVKLLTTGLRVYDSTIFLDASFQARDFIITGENLNFTNSDFGEKIRKALGAHKKTRRSSR
jgi:hypothetical protein